MESRRGIDNATAIADGLQRLAVAVLERAVQDYRLAAYVGTGEAKFPVKLTGVCGSGYAHPGGVREWFEKTHDDPRFRSFGFWCDIAGIDPKLVLQRLREIA